MKLKVNQVQNILRKCFLCGCENDASLQVIFCDMEDGSVACNICYDERFQSYPGRVHGGMIATLLDELCSRALHPVEPKTWAVTGEMTVKYRRPTPIGVPLTARAIVEENSSRMFIPKAELRDAEGNLLAMATGKYVKLSEERISNVPLVGGEWIPPQKEAPEFIEWNEK